MESFRRAMEEHPVLHFAFAITFFVAWFWLLSLLRWLDFSWLVSLVAGLVAFAVGRWQMTKGDGAEGEAP